MSYKLNICDEFMSSHKMISYISNSFIKIENHNLNFDKLMKDYKTINLRSNQDVYKKFTNV